MPRLLQQGFQYCQLDRTELQDKTQNAGSAIPNSLADALLKANPDRVPDRAHTEFSKGDRFLAIPYGWSRRPAVNWSDALDPLEIAANGVMTLSIGLAARNSVHTWATGVAACVLFGVVFLRNQRSLQNDLGS